MNFSLIRDRNGIVVVAEGTCHLHSMTTTTSNKYFYRYVSSGRSTLVQQQGHCQPYSYNVCQRYATAIAGGSRSNSHYWRRRIVPTINTILFPTSTRRFTTTNTKSSTTITTNARQDRSSSSIINTTTKRKGKGDDKSSLSGHALWTKVFADHFHRTNSTNTAFLRQYYSLLKMERKLHQLIHQYVQCLQNRSQEQFSPSSSEGGDLFFQLLRDNTNSDGTTKPVKIMELPSPHYLMLLPHLLNAKVLPPTSAYHATESLYQDIVNLANKICVAWCNITTTLSMPPAASAPASPPPSDPSSTSSCDTTTTSITEDAYSNLDGAAIFYIPCNVMRAQYWLYAVENFCFARQAFAQQSAMTVPTFTDTDSHGSRPYNDTTNLSTGGILRKVTSFVRSVFNTPADTKRSTKNAESAETTLSDPKRPEITIHPDYPILPLNEEEKNMVDQPVLGPSALLYQSLLTAYGRAYTARPNPILTMKMEQLLAHLEYFSSSNKFVPKPDHNMFIILMRHYEIVKNAGYAIAKKSDALLQRMDAEEAAASTAHFPQQHSNQLQVQNNTLNIARTNMSTSSSSSTRVVTADVIMNVMRAYSRVKRNTRAALRCEALLERLEEAESGGHAHLAPTTEAYNICLRAFFNAQPKSKVASHTERILSRMVDRHKKGMQNGIPNTMTYNVAIATVSAVISEKKEDPAKALSWIEYVEREYTSYQLQQHAKVKTKEKSSNSITAVRAPPSTSAYNAYLQAVLSYKEEQQVDDEVQQDNLVDTMERLYNNMVSHSVSKPDYTTFDRLFQIYCCCKGLVNAAERAEALLSRMEVQYATGTNNIVKPDAQMCYFVIKCWANRAAHTTGKINAASRAYSIVKTMELQASIGNVEMNPTKREFTAVIYVCSCTTQLDYKPEALRIAFECYNNMILRGIQPSAQTYICLLRCCANLVHDPRKRHKLAWQVFGDACVRSLIVSCLICDWKLALIISRPE